MQSEITIKDIVTPGVLTCPPDMPVAEAARRMAERRRSSIVIENAGRFVGIWTEQDALGLDLADPAALNAPIARFMSAPVRSLPVDTAIGEAALRFREQKVRHFLVTDADGAPCGIVSQSDIVINQGIEYFISLREVKSVFNRGHRTVPGEMPLADAVLEMRQACLDAIIVKCARRGHGIVTERDVVRMIGARVMPATIAELASYPLIALPLDTSLFQARKQFVENRIRHLGVTGDDGALLGLITFADILANIEHEYVRYLREALKESEASLAVSNQHVRLAAKAFESTFEGIVVTDAANVIESVNPAFTRITGYQAYEVVGKTPAVLSSGRHDAAFYQAMYETLSATGHWQGEICNRRKNGEIYVEWLTINAVRDRNDKITNYVAVFTDFTSRKAAEEQMRFLAQHDALTGLPNRTLLHERLARAIPHAQRNGKKLAVIFLDLDDFKETNDEFGHNAGDEVLRAVAQRLAGCVRAEDTVSRLGGDEFVLVLEDIASEASVPAIAEKIVAAVAEPVSFEGSELSVATSVGIALYPDGGMEVGELIAHADAAMYMAKEKGRNRYCFFAGGEVLS